MPADYLEKSRLSKLSRFTARVCIKAELKGYAFSEGMEETRAERRAELNTAGVQHRENMTKFEMTCLRAWEGIR